MVSPGFPCFHHRMTEQHFLDRLQSLAAQPRMSPDLTGIQIHWGEEAVNMIKIRHRHTRTAKKALYIGSEPGWQHGYDAQLAWDSWPQMILIPLPGRRAI
jgi:hypothetical protein